MTGIHAPASIGDITARGTVLAGIDMTMGRFQGAWDSFSFSQKVVMAGIVLAVVVSLVVFTMWIRKPDYAVLFSDLDIANAGEITQELEQAGVEYKVTRGGTTVLVPSDRVAELRVTLASAGVIHDDQPGYIVLDDQNIGVTDFVQNVNYRRAIEGELARSVSSLTVVEKARVHIVFEKPSIFKDKGQEATASVIVRLKPGQTLNKSQIMGITKLVAFSVEGLDQKNVSIIDQTGTMLTSNNEEEGAGIINSQIEIKRTLEDYLAGKAQEMLEAVLGSGRAIVRVNAEMDFRDVETTREVFDPQTVVRSEQTTEESNEQDGSRSENTTTNYDINRTLETIVGGSGGIKQLTIAVTVDGHYETGEDGNRQYSPLSAAELSELEAIVKSAVGFDPKRNDVIKIVNLQFPSMGVEDITFRTPVMDWLPGVIGKVITMAILVMMFLFFRKHLGQMFSEGTGFSVFRTPAVMRAGGKGMSAAPGTLAPITAEESLEERTREISSNDPEQVAKLVQTWMAES